SSSSRSVPREDRRRRLAPVESEIDAGQHGLDILSDVPCFADSAPDEIEWNGTGSEIHEIVFEEERPIRHEHPFGAAADRPTGARDVGKVEGRAELGRQVVIAQPDPAAFDVEQPVQLDRKADPPGERAKPMYLRNQIEIRILRIDDVAVQACSLEHSLNADD